MDSQNGQSDPLLRIWRLLFGGSEALGMTRLMVVLAAFILFGGLFFGIITR
ncbi:hypothetical protein [Aureimonas sp. AU40]|uniref:hypothetical protein n=1 Tax=Aureimonas sp. AU40 TaxID=1637747 RepID=UPI000A52A53C|nr:hypothetical protein [Aureimonas sp. AU40]